MAARILANLIVMGSGILARGFVQAYRQALANASKSGVAQETVQNTFRRASKVMTEQEARQILSVTEETPWEEIVKKYDTLFEKNAQNGSFYLQSKVHRAKERLETLHQSKGSNSSGTGNKGSTIHYEPLEIAQELFTINVLVMQLLKGFKGPRIDKYDGSTDPVDHATSYHDAMRGSSITTLKKAGVLDNTRLPRQVVVLRLAPTLHLNEPRSFSKVCRPFSLLMRQR
ncbi:mitochondrial import inner membrane translocase subunit PAM16 like 2-like isoform X2 [Momordica charantia]|uniref:Mitochondrial import inner membrane translocase subunit PAM16 like 2-like isoform X2 n=1 Tax=Momordica charantia TaxID=3673 RepID=A0A6J1DUD6_MOMCH|nr:mitochondrial import inner membrane translocase subunit PAM16 like 2-like isoform X2 [Momordica charantia]